MNRIHSSNWNFPARFLSATHQMGRILRRDVIGMTPEQIRKTLDGFARLYPGHMSVGYESTHMGSVPAARLYPKHPRNANLNQHILLIHGGGFAFGSARTHRALASALVIEMECEVWLPEYRLAPEHAFPEPLEDVLEAYAHLSSNAKDVWVLGDSAGGNLAMTLCLDAAEKGWASPKGLMLLSPWLDLTPNSKSNRASHTEQSPFDRLDMIEYATHYLQGTPPYHPRCNPLVRDLSDLPLIYAEASEMEYLWPDYERMRKAFAKTPERFIGRVEAHALHGWQLFPDLLPEAKRSIKGMTAFMNKTLVDSL